MRYNQFTILLSASVPSEKRSEKYQENYTKIKNAQIQIEEAVIGLSRNIFQAGGKIVFGGHPSISPLVTMIATEFRISKEIENVERNERDEKLISIFQSKAYQKVIPKETTNLFNLGYSEIVWTDSIDGEEYDPNIKRTSQCNKSLEHMRKKMMQGKINALVCIGGMEGVESEFDLFSELHPNKPIFVLKSTGGASMILAKKFSNRKNVRIIDDIDYPSLKKEEKGDKHAEKFELIPYTFITALIIREVLNKENN